MCIRYGVKGPLINLNLQSQLRGNWYSVDGLNKKVGLMIILACPAVVELVALAGSVVQFAKSTFHQSN